MSVARNIMSLKIQHIRGLQSVTYIFFWRLGWVFFILSMSDCRVEGADYLLEVKVSATGNSWQLMKTGWWSVKGKDRQEIKVVKVISWELTADVFK